jgi:hypothetical protein
MARAARTAPRAWSVIGSILLAGVARAGEAPSRWWVTTSADPVSAGILGKDSSIHQLKKNWSCSVSSISGALSSGETRTLACKRFDSVVELSIQCSTDFVKQRIHFPASDRDATDWIELGCDGPN